MKYSLPTLICLLVMMGSCTTAYQNMQTPDDVYYSDGRPEEIAIIRESEPEYPTRMKCRDRRWRDLNDDYGCHYDPYHYGYFYPYYYNPYYYPYPVFNSIPATNSTPHYSNLAGYNNTRTVVNIKTGQSTILKGPDSYNNSNSGGGLIRSVLNSAGSSGGGRTYSPTKGSSSSGSGQSIIRPSRN